MARTYHLWNRRIGSRLGRFASAEEARAFVRGLGLSYPDHDIGELSLNWDDGSGNVGQARTGQAILDGADDANHDRPPARQPRMVPAD